MSRALVTGCAGFIGSHLAEELLRRDWTVSGIDNFTPTYETVPRRHIVETLSQSPSFRFTEGDLGEMELTQHIEDADVVFHLAARPGVRASWGDFGNSARSNIFATQRLLLLATAPRRGDGVVIGSEPSTRLVSGTRAAAVNEP